MIDMRQLGLTLDAFSIGRREIAALGLAHAPAARISLDLVAASICINLFGLALPLVILQVYDRVIPNKALDTLAWLLTGLTVVIGCDTLLRIARGYLAALAGSGFAHSAPCRAFESILFDSVGSGHDKTRRLEAPVANLQRMAAVQNLANFLGGRTRLLLMDLPFIPLHLAVVWLIGGPLVLVSLASVGLFAAASAGMWVTLRRTIRQCDRQDARIEDFLGDVFAGIITLKGMGMEPQFVRRFERLQRRAATISFELIEKSALSQSTVLLFSNLSMIAIVSIGALFTIDGQLSVGALAACSLLTGRVVQPVLSAISLRDEVQRIRLGLKDIGHIEEQRPQGGSIPAKLIGPPEIRFDALQCATMNGSSLAVPSMTLRAGEMIALVGDGGSGKSALLEVICGLAAPASGSVHVGGLTPVELRARHLQSIAYVARNSECFRGTILENLTLFGRGCSESQGLKAAAALGLDRDIDRLPKGYMTEIGDGISATLPIGLLRRIAIARSIAPEPNLLLLDEPQASLDSVADAALRRCLSGLKGQVTIVMATSRPSYAALADRVLRCQGGVAEVSPDSDRGRP